jgi:hypothetical protein
MNSSEPLPVKVFRGKDSKKPIYEKNSSPNGPNSPEINIKGCSESIRSS